MVLEGFCARLAAQRVTVDQLLEMGKVVGRLEAASAGDDELLPDTLQRLHAISLRLGTVR